MRAGGGWRVARIASNDDYYLRPGVERCAGTTNIAWRGAHHKDHARCMRPSRPPISAYCWQHEDQAPKTPKAEA